MSDGQNVPLGAAKMATPEQIAEARRLGQPMAGGCPAAHLLIQQREQFGSSIKDSINALWRILRIARKASALCADSARQGGPRDMVGEMQSAGGEFERIAGIADWALSSDPSALFPTDHCALVDSSAPPASPSPASGAPASP